MDGQWLGKIDGEYEASLRVELEKRGEFLVGQAYLFYETGAEMPGFAFVLRLSIQPPHFTTVGTVYLYPDGGVMSLDDRLKAEQRLTERFGELPVPPSLDLELQQNGCEMQIVWAAQPEQIIKLKRSETDNDSELEPRSDMLSWSEFRQWAISQKPRNYIFRGQSLPYKLVSTFHRTWRNNLKMWINDDVNMLFYSLAERVNYPLQLEKRDHNGAFWSILQHHGYPTPMLDWSYSPFVAAFFALQDVKPEQERLPRMFIFDLAAWNERYGRQSFIVDDAPEQLVALESMLVGNPRSAPQQALFTVVNVADIESFIKGREARDGQTYLTVCDFPLSDRPQILRELEMMGITYGSLFPGIDGVCRDMKDRLFAAPAEQAATKT